MTWEAELEEIRRRRELAREMGGPERIARHVAEGRTPVRDRIGQLLDDGSFREIGSLASRVEYDEEGRIKGYTPSNFITGRGTIDGRPVIIGADDFTVRGGAADGAVGNKMGWSERTAREMRLPLVRLMGPAAAAASGRTLRSSDRMCPRIRIGMSRSVCFRWCLSWQRLSVRSPAWEQPGSQPPTSP